MRAVVFLIFAAACSGSTGSGLVTFTARAGGPADATSGLEFDTGFVPRYHVALSTATLHLGAVYLDMSVPSSGGPSDPCILPGIYVGQAFANFDVDLLSPALSNFPTPGDGIANPAAEAEVWLASGDVNEEVDPTPIFTVAGTASRDGESWPFSASVTVGDNRAIGSQDPATPGANPICRRRIVHDIPVAFTLSNGATLDLRVDPRGMFNAVDFATLSPQAGNYLIPDEDGGAGGALFGGVTANSGVYSFSLEQKGD